MGPVRSDVELMTVRVDWKVAFSDRPGPAIFHTWSGRLAPIQRPIPIPRVRGLGSFAVSS